MRDSAYSQLNYHSGGIQHAYGDNIHILGTPLLLTKLARLCSNECEQPEVNVLIAGMYREILNEVMNAEFPRKEAAIPTRMIQSTPKGIYQGQVLDRETRVITINIARAGTLPSQVTFDTLNTILAPRLVRQDHIIMSRLTNDEEQVVGSAIGGSKIGGDVDNAIMLVPDPMGATGGSVSAALRMYRDTVSGKAKKIIAMHLIVTPEYLKRMKQDFPEVIVYAIRLDRGMSPADVLKELPGKRWDEEKGLDDRDYIVPGAGGLGEIMNNAYV